MAIDFAFQAYAESSILHSVEDCNLIFAYFNSKNPFIEYQSKKILNKVTKKIYLDYLNKPKSLDKKIRENQNLIKKLEKIWGKYDLDKQKNFSTQILSDFFNEFIKIATWCWYYFFIGEDKGAVISLEVIPNFVKRNKINEHKAKKIVDILSYPEEQSVFIQERKSFLIICLSILKNPKVLNQLKNKNFIKVLQNKKIKELVNKYLKNYFWFKSNFYYAQKITNESLLLEILDELNSKTILKLKKEFKQLDSNFLKFQKNKNKLLKQIKLSNKDKKDIYFAQRTIYWIDQRKLGMMKLFYYFFSFLEKVSKKFKIDYDVLSLYTMDELQNLLKSNKKIHSIVLQKRKRGVFIIFQKNKTPLYFYQKETSDILKAIENKVKDNLIKGIVASSGNKKLIKGIVRIVSNPQKNKFQKGEILVTSMTRVEFMPLIWRAQAIVTDEGGIACHAAIISRELNKPCIIGTKIATKILKDGDLVEVDANKGVIKILKRQK